LSLCVNQCRAASIASKQTRFCGICELTGQLQRLK
jgi:hypothetical protein